MSRAVTADHAARLDGPDQASGAVDTAPVGRTRRTLTVAVLSGVVLGACAFVGRWSMQSYFYRDDYPNFGFARSEHLSLDHLGTPVFQHLAPGHRLGDWLLTRFAPLNWPVSQAVMLAVFAACLVLVWAIIVEANDGRSRSGALVLAFVVGTSLLPLSALQWWAAALHTLPSGLGSLVAMWAWLRFRRTRSPWWLAASLGALALGLLFLIKPILVPFYLVLFRLLALDRDRPLREVARSAVDEWRVWVAYAAVVVGYLAYYVTRQHEVIAVADPVTVLRFVLTSWYRIFAPSVVGYRMAPLTGNDADPGLVLANLILLAVAIASLVRDRSTWRVWAFVGIAWVPNAVLVGAPRLLAFGNSYTYPPYYFLEPGFLLAIAVGVAFSGPSRPMVRRPALLWGLVVVALAARSWVADTGMSRLTDAWGGPRAGEYMGTVRRSVEERTSGGRRAISVVDGPMPYLDERRTGETADRLSDVVPLMGLPVVFGQLSEPLYAVDGEGQLAPVGFDRLWSVTPDELNRHGSLHAGTPPTNGAANGELCVADAQMELVDIGTVEVGGGDRWLTVSYRANQAGTMAVFVDRGAGYTEASRRTLTVEPGRSGTALTSIHGPDVRTVRLDVPPGEPVCLSDLSIGLIRPRAER